MDKHIRIDYFFQEISKIPRGSCHEKEICDYVENFAKNHQLKFKRDKMHNIIVYKNATVGYENHETVMLEGHMDMVCEKNNDSLHDFEKDPIELIEKDGFLWANQTTLGADDGVGVCYMLAILEDETLKHPALECVFTVQEEIGLNGAMALQKDDFHASKMIGLDSGDENVVTVSCSGGRRAVIQRDIVYIDNNQPSYQIMVNGLQGGHSGELIDKEKGNANQIMARVYYHLLLNHIDFYIGSLKGGLKDNAIPRECVSTFASRTPRHQIEKIIRETYDDIHQELLESDDGIQISIESVESLEKTLSLKDSQNIISMMYLMPNGFVHKSLKMNVPTVSLNMGVVELKRTVFDIHFSIRSPMESAKNELTNQLSLIAHLYDAKYIEENNYPGWTYVENSPLRQQYIEFVKENEGIELKQEATHGGLETGILKGLLPHLDIITLGPDMFDIHSPDEHLNIASYHRCYKRLVQFLECL